MNEMKMINCPGCGKRLPADRRACPECGFPIGEYVTRSAPVRRRRRKGLRLLLPAVLVLFLALFFLRGAGGRKEAAAPADDAQAPRAEASSPSPVGVYIGDDNERLVIAPGGLAHYYCVSSEYAETDCPWTFENGVLRITFAKTHCVATAEAGEDGFDPLILRSESRNWNTEVFTRADIDPEEYRQRPLQAHDRYVTLLEDSSMRFTLCGITFTVPKECLDLEDVFDERDDVFLFLDIDMEKDTQAGLLFAGNYPESPEDFTARFVQNPSLGEGVPTLLAGREAVSHAVTGTYSESFGPFIGGSACTGQILCLEEGGESLKVLFLRTETDPDGRFDAVFQEVLAGASDTKSEGADADSDSDSDSGTDG